MSTEGGGDSPDWVQAPVALRDFEKLVMRLEKTYDKKEYENQPRLAVAYGASSSLFECLGAYGLMGN